MISRLAVLISRVLPPRVSSVSLCPFPVYLTEASYPVQSLGSTIQAHFLSKCCIDKTRLRKKQLVLVGSFHTCGQLSQLDGI